MKKLFSKQGGFTFPEIIIALAIFSIVTVALYGFIRITLIAQSRSFAIITASNEARRAVSIMTTDIRGAIQSESGSYPIETAQNQALTIYSNIDTDAQAEKIRYFLSGTDLRRGVIQPQGTPAAYPPASEQISTIARYVRNGATPIFYYYDKNYTGTQNPMNPINIGNIRYIKIILIIDDNPSRNPLPVTVEGAAQLRNLKDNL